ncbi:hypothetical protein VOI32_15605 [Paraburkholderia caribensis]|uniref:Uncharacterized protein n=2 Tax=Paraburkholderia caribensis TaxID=75105 RepID=A0A9Q6WL81_9BURK|nr:hypothetical protein [Paraburkholderia caribensis]MCO4875782.1 hypothetical protein [Paraburkholderia caribensis]QLB62583.1 hypothetical protein A9O66_09435 [Paraburkholderia caribensis]
METDLLQSNKNTFISIGHVLQDMIGTSTLFSGLGCVPTAPAGMTVNVNPGRAYSLQATDTGPWSSLLADATPLMKQGILLAAQNFSCPAPSTAGFSINYLIQGAFQEVDGGSAVLPYYNAANPSQAFSGPNGTGTSNTTYRDNTVQLQLKAGVAATTGSQITPTPDSGFTGLWVVTVPFGASTITSGNISQYAGAPFLPASLLAMIQQAGGSYAVATGTANAHVAAFTPPITARVDGMVLRYKAPAANTGALTFNDGLGAVAVVGAAHSALQGGETAANGDVWVQWNSSIGGGSYVMLDSTGGALQVGAATQPSHALQAGQALGLYLGTQVITSSTTYTPGTYTIGGRTVTATKGRFRGTAPGGAGGGSTATGAGQAAAGGGGSAGNTFDFLFSPLTSLSITMGAAGAGSSGAAGGTGGSLTIGSIATIAGGRGGNNGGVLGSFPGNSGGGGIAASSTIGGTGVVVIENIPGQTGDVGVAFGTGYVKVGFGGQSRYGSGGVFNQGAGSGYGAGGLGGGAGQSSGATSGFAGAPGLLIIDEYA